MYTIEYYSVITRKEIGSFVVMWLNPESVIESEASQKEKNKCIYMESRKKMAQMNLVAGQEERCT